MSTIGGQPDQGPSCPDGICSQHGPSASLAYAAVRVDERGAIVTCKLITVTLGARASAAQSVFTQAILFPTIRTSLLAIGTGRRQHGDTAEDEATVARAQAAPEPRQSP
jgi:hypothetical protein